MRQPIRVLFVCLGNICRSPLGEGILRDKVQKLGLEGRIEVDSAGTAGYHIGEKPDKRAIAVARRFGIDISGLRGRQIEKSDLDSFDYVLAMDRANYKDIQALGVTHHKAQLDLLLSFHPDEDVYDVPDPFYGGPEDFTKVFDQIETACRYFLDELDHERGG